MVPLSVRSPSENLDCLAAAMAAFLRAADEVVLLVTVALTTAPVALTWMDTTTVPSLLGSA